jgi:leucyl aminopeptidase
MEQIQVPQCLAAKLGNFSVLAQNKDFKILNIPSSAINELALKADQINCGRFINVTPQVQGETKKALALLNQPLIPKKAAFEIDYYTTHQREVSEALEKIQIENIMNSLKDLTSFYNRSATTLSGKEAADWLHNSFQRLVAKSGRKHVKSYFIKTGENNLYQQPSLVTVIGDNKTEPAIVLGAHMDTLDGLMPGAGDDASGSAALLEIARILLDSPMEYDRPIYLIWYAAEERGLLGSHYVVQDFLEKTIPVQSVIQFDMVGFRSDPQDATMWVYKDPKYTDKKLTNFLVRLIETYIGVPVGESACGYGCSDHVSWALAGIPAAFPCETDFDSHNKKIHTSEDTIDRLTPEHMLNFTKLGLAFAIELGLK